MRIISGVWVLVAILIVSLIFMGIGYNMEGYTNTRWSSYKDKYENDYHTGGERYDRDRKKYGLDSHYRRHHNNYRRRHNNHDKIDEHIKRDHQRSYWDYWWPSYTNNRWYDNPRYKW